MRRSRGLGDVYKRQVFDAAVAHVPGQRASNFAADLREDGLTVVELLPGKAAHLV